MVCHVKKILIWLYDLLEEVMENFEVKYIMLDNSGESFKK